VEGEDLHTRTARAVLGREKVSHHDRELGKALTFGLLYGLGAEGFRRYARARYGLSLTDVEARRYRDGFFAA
jgi:DNA polymerase I